MVLEMGDRRTSSKREYISVDADSMPGKRVLSSRATRKGTRREMKVCASVEEESGYAERCREANAYATLYVQNFKYKVHGRQKKHVNRGLTGSQPSYMRVGKLEDEKVTSRLSTMLPVWS